MTVQRYTPLKPLRPFINTIYGPVLILEGSSRDRLPKATRSIVTQLCSQHISAPEDEIDDINAELVSLTFWYALRPNEIANRVIRYHGLPPRVLSIGQAALILAAIGEAGYPINGNGAPDYDGANEQQHPPICGEERNKVLWDAAYYWAEAASRHITYVSLGDCRGYMPRQVQYDQPGSIHPGQQASLTFGPEADRNDPHDSHGYMRTHTRKLLLVRGRMDEL